MKLTVAIVGSRSYSRREDILEAVRFLQEYHPGWKLVSGGATGPDTWAREAALALGVTTQEIRPDWSLGRTAGLIRNREIVGRADVVIAFWDGISSGTRNTMEIARACGKQVLVVTLYPFDPAKLK